MIEALLELVVARTGLRVLELLGRKDPVELESMLAGLGIWLLVGLAIPAVQRRIDRNLARQGSVNAGIRLSNNATSLSPVILTAAMMARAMNPAMRLYSMAVAPFSSRRNFRSIHCPPSFDKMGVARSSCCKENQKRKIAALLRARLPGGRR
jgi:hypothetical protein